MSGIKSKMTVKKQKFKYYILDLPNGKRVTHTWGTTLVFTSRTNAEKGLCRYLLKSLRRNAVSDMIKFGQLIPNEIIADRIKTVASLRSFICSFIKKDYNLYLKIMDIFLKDGVSYNQFEITSEKEAINTYLVPIQEET